MLFPPKFKPLKNKSIGSGLLFQPDKKRLHLIPFFFGKAVQRFLIGFLIKLYDRSPKLNCAGGKKASQRSMFQFIVYRVLHQSICLFQSDQEVLSSSADPGRIYRPIRWVAPFFLHDSNYQKS
jgi:hypothetical protein